MLWLTHTLLNLCTTYWHFACVTTSIVRWSPLINFGVTDDFGFAPFSVNSVQSFFPSVLFSQKYMTCNKQKRNLLILPGHLGPSLVLGAVRYVKSLVYYVVFLVFLRFVIFLFFFFAKTLLEKTKNLEWERYTWFTVASDRLLFLSSFMFFMYLSYWICQLINIIILISD